MIAIPSRFTTALVILSIVGFLPTCRVWGEQRAMERGKKKPIGISNAKSANAELEEEVSAKLATDERLKSANLAVSADVTKNQITIAGTLSSDRLRAKAVELAKSAQAGVIVNDRITVKPKAGRLPPE